jgi:hypothetical protein
VGAGRDAEPAVVIDAGEDLELGAALEHHAAHHVYLPQLHGTITLEPAELVSALAATAELDWGLA